MFRALLILTTDVEVSRRICYPLFYQMPFKIFETFISIKKSSINRINALSAQKYQEHENLITQEIT